MPEISDIFCSCFLSCLFSIYICIFLLFIYILFFFPQEKARTTKEDWKKQVEEETEKTGVTKEDVLNRTKWRNGVQAIAEGKG